MRELFLKNFDEKLDLRAISQGDVHICFDGVFKGNHFEFFVEDVIRGNSVQIALDFPAKSLSIYLNEFFSTLFWLFNEKIT